MTIDTDRLRALAALDPDTVRALLDAAELGLAWQRAVAALPEGWGLGVDNATDEGRAVARAGRIAFSWPPEVIVTTGPNPAAALNALADALEAWSENT